LPSCRISKQPDNVGGFSLWRSGAWDGMPVLLGISPAFDGPVLLFG
jgi:hypothetical protein